MMNHHNNSSQQSNATFYSQTSNSSSSSSSTRSGGGGGIDRVFNSLGNITQDGYDLEQRMHQYQQQHKHDKKQITTYDKRIKNFEKTITKKDEENSTLRGQLKSHESTISSLEKEKKNLSDTIKKLSDTVKQTNEEERKTNEKWFAVGQNVSSKVSTYLKNFDFNKCIEEQKQLEDINSTTTRTTTVIANNNQLQRQCTPNNSQEMDIDNDEESISERFAKAAAAAINGVVDRDEIVSLVVKKYQEIVIEHDKKMNDVALSSRIEQMKRDMENDKGIIEKMKSNIEVADEELKNTKASHDELKINYDKLEQKHRGLMKAYQELHDEYGLYQQQVERAFRNGYGGENSNYNNEISTDNTGNDNSQLTTHNAHSGSNGEAIEEERQQQDAAAAIVPVNETTSESLPAVHSTQETQENQGES